MKTDSWRQENSLVYHCHRTSGMIRFNLPKNFGCLQKEKKTTSPENLISILAGHFCLLTQERKTHVLIRQLSESVFELSLV